MKQFIFALFAVFLSVSFMAGEAEAKRFGGGKSSGMQRSAPQRDMTPQRQNAGQQQAAPASPKRNWLGPIAGLAAGLGLAALFSHFGMGEGLANFMMIALLAVAAFALIGFIMRRMKPAAPRAQYAGGPAQPMQYQAQQPYGSTSSGNEAPAFQNAAQPTQFPAGFDHEAFVRVAKLNFVRLQAAYDSADLDDIREFTSPEMFAEIKLQLAERRGAANHTDVVQLDAEVVDYAQEGRRDVASVRFHGLIREAADASAERFDETWHLARHNDGRAGWVVAGIQQNG